MANPPPPWLRPDDTPEPDPAAAAGHAPANPAPANPAPDEPFDPNQTVRFERGTLPLPPTAPATPAPSPAAPAAQAPAGPVPPSAPPTAPVAPAPQPTAPTPAATFGPSAAPTAPPPPAWGTAPPAPPAPWEQPSPSAPPPYGAPAYGAPPNPAATFGPPPGYGGATTGTPFAGFGARLGARIIDALVMTGIALPFLIAGFILLARAYDDCVSFDGEIICPPGARRDGPLAAGIILFLVGGLLAWILYIRWVGTKGQTPGMRAANVKVVSAETGQPIGIGRAIGRFFAQYLSALPIYLGFFWMLWDERKQTWHDKLVNSVVIRT